MDESNAERPVNAPAARVQTPENEVVGAVARDAVGPAVCDLIDAGFAPIGGLGGGGGPRAGEADISGRDRGGGFFNRPAPRQGGGLGKAAAAGQGLGLGGGLIRRETADDDAKI